MFTVSFLCPQMVKNQLLTPLCFTCFNPTWILSWCIHNFSASLTVFCLLLSSSSGERYGAKKSLIILTSKATAGAAEEFVYIMRNLGRAMIVGETTNGSSHPPKNFHVGETDIFLSIPTVHSDTTFGPGWEGAGIAPHIPVPADDALEYAKTVLNKHFAGQK